MVEANIQGMHSEFAEARLGQIFAFILSIAFLITGAYTAIRGQPWVGGVLGTMGIGSIVGTFVKGRSTHADIGVQQKPDQQNHKSAKKKKRSQ